MLFEEHKSFLKEMTLRFLLLLLFFLPLSLNTNHRIRILFSNKRTCITYNPRRTTASGVKIISRENN